MIQKRLSNEVGTESKKLQKLVRMAEGNIINAFLQIIFAVAIWWLLQALWTGRLSLLFQIRSPQPFDSTALNFLNWTLQVSASVYVGILAIFVYVSLRQWREAKTLVAKRQRERQE